MAKKAAGASDEEMAELQAEGAREANAEQAAAIVESELRRAGRQLREADLRTREVPFAVSRAMAQLIGIVHLAFIRPDPGEGAAESGWQLAAEAAPEPSRLDSWARGAIPTKRRRKKVTTVDAIPSSGNKLPSESGRSKGRSVSSKLRGGPAVASIKGRESTADSKGSGGRRKRGQLPDYIVKLSAAEEESDEAPGAARRASQLRRLQNSAAEQEAREQALQEIEDKKRAAEEAQEKRIAEEQAEAARAETLAKELKGKEFSLGQDGEIIIIQPVNGDKLPESLCNVEHAIQEVDCDDGIAGDAKVQVIAQEDKHAKDANAEREGKADVNPFYRSADSFQQSVIKNPALEVQPGVSIKEGGASKSGPAFQQDARHMSREHFELHQSMLESQCMTGEADEVPKLELEASMAAAASLGAAAPAAAGAGDAAGDAEAERVPSQGSGRASPVADGADSGGEAAGDEFVAGSDAEDPNLRMLSDPGWGQVRQAKQFVPAVLPSPLQLPSPARQTVRGVEASPPPRRPRERGAAALESGAKGKHLPAPLPGRLSPVNGETAESPDGAYVREFESPVDSGNIKVESDRAYRLLGIAQNVS